MARCKIITFMTLFLIFVCTVTNVDASELIFYNLTASDGLSQTSVNCIYQDSSDYIWIGTKNGLNRYNGYEFEIYNKGFREKRNIIDSQIIVQAIVHFHQIKFWISKLIIMVIF